MTRLKIDFSDVTPGPEVITIGGDLKPGEHLRHWLIITNNNEDTGQDDYFENLEWEIEHSPDCPYSPALIFGIMIQGTQTIETTATVRSATQREALKIPSSRPARATMPTDVHQRQSL